MTEYLTAVPVFIDLDLGLAALVVIAAAILSAYVGFGGALFLVPMLTILYGPVEGIAIGFIVSFIGRVQLYPSTARIASWKDILPFSAAVAVTVPAGTAILFSMDPDIIRRLIGGFVLVAALVLMTGAQYRGRRGWIAGGVFGGACGAITGATGMGGPILVTYFISAPDPPHVQRANIVVSVAILTLILTIAFAFRNGIGASTLIRVILLLLPMIAGTWVGNWVFLKAPQKHFRYVAQAILIITGGAILIF